MSLDCGRKLEYSERAHAGEHANSRFEPVSLPVQIADVKSCLFGRY